MSKKNTVAFAVSLIASFLIIGFAKFDWSINQWGMGERITMLLICFILFLGYQFSINMKDL